MSMEKPMVMGILNVTDDSFYADSRVQTETDIVNRARQIVAEGGSIIDIGACSTRPDSEPVCEEEELRRLAGAVSLVRRELPDSIISVDTFRANVAKTAVEKWGADMVNDINGNVMEGIEHLHVPYILTSQEPTIETMMKRWSAQVRQLAERGVADVILDPGFGFGKTLQQNYEVLAGMSMAKAFNLPILAGLSRKSMIYRLLGTTPEEALNGTTALNMTALMKGADILRVHDVRQAAETILLFETSNITPVTSTNNQQPSTFTICPSISE